MNAVFHSASRAVVLVGLLTVACERSADGDRAVRDIDRAANSTGRVVARVTREAAHGASGAIESTAESARRATAPTPTPIASGAVTTAFNEAVDRIAAARCEREQRCEHVGQGRRFDSEGACRSSVRASFADDLNPTECRVGIDQGELRECLEEVRNESCGNPIDTLERVVACRTTDLCRETTVSLR
ncbi:MAG: DUF6184 family natural product biosynthesis lipoprotein [Deltaproteobacteria bacterium]|nr:DUF6184 family natural product biosynthesis lipoprotein [Myxococcales bacterium]MDP3219069.1 DUF6184 family natural product biosynthesis lipoprotein [Deltaproteobacteria bacterium]